MKKKTPTPRAPISSDAKNNREPVSGTIKVFYHIMRHNKQDREETHQVQIPESLLFPHRHGNVLETKSLSELKKVFRARAGEPQARPLRVRPRDRVALLAVPVPGIAGVGLVVLILITPVDMPTRPGLSAERDSAVIETRFSFFDHNPNNG